MTRIEAFCAKALFYANLWMWIWCIHGGNQASFEGRKWTSGRAEASFFEDNGEFDAEIERFENAKEEENGLLTESPSPTVPPSEFSVKHRTRRLILGIVLGSTTGFAAAAVVATLMRAAVIYINRAPLLKGTVVFDPRIRSKMLSFLEQDGRLDEADLVGVGANGRVYRANLENGMAVAVKKIQRMEPHETGNNASVKRQIQEEVEILGRVRHENLVALQAYVHHPNAHLLVYDYLPNGSLEDALKKIRDNRLRLSWSVRHRIAVGTIMGLEHLHFRCNPRIVHRDLKPANILLDDEFEPRLSDFGLAKLMPNGGTAGYVAPECYQNCRYTDKSDVFSFGVVLAVLLTGKEPADGVFNEIPGGSIGRWLRHLQQTGKAFEALDPGILEEEEEGGGGGGRQEEEMLMAVRIAAACLAEMPADRPTSEELVSMLTQLHSF